MEKFVELGGGVDGKFVIVPTAGGNRGADGTVTVYQEDQILRGWKARGLKNVKMLHTHDPKVADTEEFAKVLRDATAVWFNGGRQWNCVDLVRRHADVQGIPQGARAWWRHRRQLGRRDIQGEYLVRGDTSGPNVMMTEEPNHQKAFEFIRKVAIDQHINTRLRWDDLIPVIKKYPNLLGIGLSEGTAIVVKGDQFEVMGKWKVAVHDNTQMYQPWEKPYYVLGAGDVYNMKTRKVVKYADGTTPGRRGGGGGEISGTRRR
jgi:cyanophycinase